MVTRHCLCSPKLCSGCVSLAICCERASLTAQSTCLHPGRTQVCLLQAVGEAWARSLSRRLGLWAADSIMEAISSWVFIWLSHTNACARGHTRYSYPPLHTHTHARTITSHYCQGPVPTASSHEACATFQCRRSTSLAHAGRVAEAVAVPAAVYASPAAAAAAHIGLRQQALPLALPLDRVVAVVESAA